MASGQFAALADLTLPAVVVGFFKSPAAPVMGIASIVLGVAEAETSWLAPIVGTAAGGTLIIMGWFANALKKTIEDWLKSQGKKLIDLPDAQTLRDDKKSLLAQLELFALEAGKERQEMQKFRVALAGTLADHGARITGLESRRSTDHGNS